jgi:hypothetical protein
MRDHPVVSPKNPAKDTAKNLAKNPGKNPGKKPGMYWQADRDRARIKSDIDYSAVRWRPIRHTCEGGSSRSCGKSFISIGESPAG